MHLRRTNAPRRLISLVSMIDVLLIMLVFFMVTSTYLNLDMIPMSQSESETAATNSQPIANQTVMIRLGGDGQTYLRGRPTPLDTLAATVATQSANANVLILPSARASTQSLVSLMDTLTAAGVTRLRIVQLEPSP